MKSRASLLILGLLATGGLGGALVAQQTPPGADVQEPAGNGPRGTSQAAPGEARYDEVGYAGIGDQDGVSIASGALAPGSFAEVTALDSGKTIVVSVTAGGAGGRLALVSRAAATQLGISSDLAPVRVRRVTPAPQDVALLNAGQAASGRSDAPPALLIPLRKRLGAPPRPIATQPTPAPTRTPRPVARPPVPKSIPAPVPTRAVVTPPPRPAPRVASSGYYVQVAALSNQARAKALAASIGGVVTPAGALFRVQLGPFPDSASADRGRAAAVRKGHPDARIVRTP